MSTFAPPRRLLRAEGSRRLDQDRPRPHDPGVDTQRAHRLSLPGAALRRDKTGHAPRSSAARLAQVATVALVLVIALLATASAGHGAPATDSGKPDIKEFLLPTPDARPLGITTGPDRDVWFVEFLGNKVGRITLSGRVTEFPIPTPNSTPDAIVTGADGNLWFTEVAGNKIGRITPEGVITEFTVPTPDSRPTVIAAGPDGNLWFTERGRPHPAGALDVAKVGRITTEGVITEFAVPTLGARPLGITGGPDGNVWFTESMVDKVARITPDGVVTEFPLPTACAIRCQPQEITSGPDGAVWFTEAFGNRIGRMTTNGEVTEFDLPHANSGPNVITRGPGETLFFTETGLTPDTGNRIGAITLDGKIVEWDIPTPEAAPIGVTRGPAGDIWFTETGALTNPGEKIGRIVGARGQVTAALRSGQEP
jgi:streptogramin lyase